MKALVAVSMVLAALTLAPRAAASCAAASLIGTTASSGASFIWTSGVFAPQYFAGYPPLSYGPDAGPPVTTELAGRFWRSGAGNPATGLGTDNGSYDFVNDGGFYYAAYPPYGPYYGYYGAGTIFSSWFPPGVDGCIGADNCLCLMLTDQDQSVGYFALAGAGSNANFDTFLNQGGSDGAGNQAPIILVPIPRPRIVGTVRNGFDVDVTVTIDSPVSGIYVKDGCDCGPLGYKVWQQIVPRGTLPTDDRVIVLWNSVVPDQPIRSFGDDLTFLSPCGGENDVYLAASLVFDSGFETRVVSGNATRIECGPNLADPGDQPRMDLRRIRPTAPTPRRRGSARDPSGFLDSLLEPRAG